ncbi:MAG TPA: DUF4251 domain-containing protein [Bacteroidales bacterium]|nr:DUF4251 domain-containing protein [Bacteroidales bacterium]
MKKILFLVSLITIITLLSSCAAFKGIGSSDHSIDEATLNNAIESGKFIVKFDMMFTRFGSPVFLRPRSNYLIVDGENAILSAAYLGRQYDFRPIEGIRMQGKTINYEIIKKDAKGRYSIRMNVGNGRNTFTIFLKVNKDGYVSASINSLKIDAASYSGYIESIKKQQTESREEVI